MATTTISLTTEAYEALKRLKAEGQSFSDVVLHYLPRPQPRTCGELLDELEREFEGAPITTVERLDKLQASRGGRSNRPAKGR